MAQVDLSGREPQAPLRTADGTPLKAALARASRRAQWQALALVLPLLLFILATFVLPIGQMLYRSVANPAFSANMPTLVAWFAAESAGHRARRSRLRRDGRGPGGRRRAAHGRPRRHPDQLRGPGHPVDVHRGRAPRSQARAAIPRGDARARSRLGRPGALVRDARRRRGAHPELLHRGARPQGRRRERHRPRRPGAAHLPAAVLADHVPFAR